MIIFENVQFCKKSTVHIFAAIKITKMGPVQTHE